MLPLQRTSIASRLTVQVLLFSTALAVVTTCVQLLLDYRQELRNIQSFFTSVGETSVRPLEESVWLLDDLQINLQLEGLTRRQDIVYAAVSMDGRIAWAKGAPATNGIPHTFPLVYTTGRGTEQIGELRVDASLTGVYRRLLRRVVILLSSNGVKTFLVAGFLLFLFRRSVAGRLTRLADYVQDIDISSGEPVPLVLDRPPGHEPDEMDRVAAALNGLGRSGARAFADLRRQEQQLRLFFDATNEGIFGVDTDGRCTFVNRAGLDYLPAAGTETVVGLDLLSHWDERCGHSSLPSTPAGQIRATIRERQVLQADGLPFYRKDGTALHLSVRSYPVVEAGQCTGAVAFFADTSHRHRLEQEKQLLTEVIRQAPALILITDAEGVVEYVNTSFARVTGTDPAAIVGVKAFDSLPALHLEGHAQQIRTAIRSGVPWLGTLASDSDTGRRFALKIQIFPIRDRSGQLTHVVAMGRDVTREQELTAHLQQAQKMELLGRMTASLAHEFGNPLLGIRFALRDVQQRPELAPDDRQLLQLAEEECDRMRTLIRDLQQFNRPSSGRKSACDLHRLLEEVLALHRTYLDRKRVEVTRAFSAQPIRLQAVEDQIRQVFVNLLLNASDALAVSEQGGRLTITTALRGGMAVVSFADNGPGIRPEDMGRVFEPFFTTKPMVEGTGLGLPVSYGIVLAHGGTIEVRSQPGETVFTVALPVTGRPDADRGPVGT